MMFMLKIIKIILMIMNKMITMMFTMMFLLKIIKIMLMIMNKMITMMFMFMLKIIKMMLMKKMMKIMKIDNEMMMDDVHVEDNKNNGDDHE